MKLEEKFTLLEERRDLELIYPAMDILCLTSKSEGFSNVLGEAMSCGVPCIATDVGDSRAIVGNAGFLVQPGDARGIAEVIEELSMLGSLGRVELGAKARRRILECYSLEGVSRRYLRLYQSLLEKNCE